MGRFKDYRLLAAVLGVLVTTGPVLWFYTWLHKQGEAEVSVAASWTVGNVDVQIGRAVSVLETLAERRINGCGDAQLELLRRAMLTAGPVKELSVVSPQGRTLCTDRGDAIASREVISSAPTADPRILLDVVRLDAGDERMLRVRRVMPSSRVSLAALLPAELLLPLVTPGGSRFAGYARIALPDDTVVGGLGSDIDAALRDGLMASRARSDRYGLVVTTATARDSTLATYHDVRRVGVVVTGLLALIILVGALLLPRRERHPFYDIERAIGAGELVPYYQPIVDLKSGAIVGAEVLVRWRKRDGSLVLPSTFVPLLEPTDLILDMTRSIMRQVGEEVGALLEYRANMYVAFNIAPRHFMGDTLIDDIAAAFVGGPISTSQIVLELTERYEIEDLAATRSLIAELQGLGCRVAIDDVGTGHNGLSYILKLGVDIIKIDKMFVDAIGTEAHSRAIVDTLVDLARNLRMQIVAEGVETFEQVVYLRDHGITSAQGFVFSPPLPATAFIQLIEAIDPVGQKAPRAVLTGEGVLPVPGVPRGAAA
ncbi:MAG: EAL domain-containing protein [Xanthobacteraceae bacterium]|nr:EAL domain-containing protein [Xanthobacteraceae bacterium]